VQRGEALRGVVVHLELDGVGVIDGG